jgi:short-subunit dehydrogenase
MKKSAVLITGASAGLGTEFAKLFAADRHNLVLVARRKDRLDQLAKDLAQLHKIDTHVIAVDLEDPHAPQSIFDETKERDLFIDHLVNNAGFGYTSAFEDAGLKADTGMIQVNVTALVSLTKLFLPDMKAHSRGHILNIGSTAGFLPGPYMATYFATKAFVNSFSEALTQELKDTGITVTLSCPGPTSTEFGQRSGTDKKPLFNVGTATAESVAQEAYNAMKAGDRRIIHNLKNKITATLAGWTPNTILMNVVQKIQGPSQE